MIHLFCCFFTLIASSLLYTPLHLNSNLMFTHHYKLFMVLLFCCVRLHELLLFPVIILITIVITRPQWVKVHVDINILKYKCSKKLISKKENWVHTKNCKTTLYCLYWFCNNHFVHASCSLVNKGKLFFYSMVTPDTAKNMFLSYYYYLTFMRELANEIWLFRTQTKCCWYYSNILIMNPHFYYHGKVKTKFPNILQYALLQTFKSNLMSILPLYKYYNH